MFRKTILEDDPHLEFKFYSLNFAKVIPEYFSIRKHNFREEFYMYKYHKIVEKRSIEILKNGKIALISRIIRVLEILYKISSNKRNKNLNLNFKT